jgi:aspartate/methionine/tyrosine aminotransferase
VPLQAALPARGRWTSTSLAGGRDAGAPGCWCVNAPSNPTGWTLTRAASSSAILDHCRRTGTWILADEVLRAAVYEDDPASTAPSFLDIAVVGGPAHGRCGSFSKRLSDDGLASGLAGAAGHGAARTMSGKLIEFNTSCAPRVRAARRLWRRWQRADDDRRRGSWRHLETCRDRAGARPAGAARGGAWRQPAGGMYAFFRLVGYPDAVDTAKRLVRQARPGSGARRGLRPGGGRLVALVLPPRSDLERL